ncbi:MAG: 3'-5' exonuclease, partial [Lachnospiraceae bacterium]
MKVLGNSREAEEQQLKKILEVAQNNLERTRKRQEGLSEQLKEMLDNFDAEEKQMNALWNNTKSMFQESKRELLRCIKSSKKPYFGRIDFKATGASETESYYVGRVGISPDGVELLVIDWRAPIASVYYENALGPCTYEVKGVTEGETVVHEIELTGKRTYEIEDGKLIDFYDSDIVANDELLTKFLAKSKRAVLGEIIGTIQKEQNAIIRMSPKTNLIVQGVAGSGKTTVAMHRISYILYNYEQFRPVDFYIVGSNRILLNYITGVLPELDVYGVSQMTMEQLLTRLLYEDWDDKKYEVVATNPNNKEAYRKGEYAWFHKLEAFCDEYEAKVIPTESVVIEKNGTVLLEKKSIENYRMSNPQMSVQAKINALNEWLLGKLENELTGKSISYTPEEKKELNRSCKVHFGRDEWKGSLFDLYEEFLKRQRKCGSNIFAERGKYDVYDLAALAYLYKRIKEIDPIREASHVIIDEAQDFGMMVYATLAYCLRGCTYTIMGDVSQNIHYGYGLNDWEELRNLILTGDYDNFGILKKSYRNTVEISEFATEILRHGSFSIYPAEPILRHGKPVSMSAYDTEEEMNRAVVSILKNWEKEGHGTIAVICADGQEADKVTGMLGKEISLADSNPATAVFNEGVMVLPVEYTKGLEFDAVVLYHPSKENYPSEDRYVKLLYVAATRALHELAVVHLHDLTELIAIPVSEEKRLSSLERQQDTLHVATPRVVPKITEEKKQTELARILERTTKRYGLNQPKESVEAVGKTVAVPEADPALNTSPYQFNSPVEAKKMTPKGHSRIDCGVRWVKKSKTFVDFVSNYGILRVTPLTEEIVRVRFVRGQADLFPDGNWKYTGEKKPSFLTRENATVYEIVTKKLVVRIEKKSGALAFFDTKGILLLKESLKEPRLIEPDLSKTWNYFEWEKNEKIVAKGILDTDLQQVNGKARYISIGGKKKRMPLLLSRKGYGISVSAEDTVSFCGVGMYGQYICTEKEKQIDYYVLFGG